MSTITLMCGDFEVLRFDFKSHLFEVLNSNLLPFELKGVVRTLPPNADLNTNLQILDTNRQAITNWLSHRVLSLSRTNAKKLYNALGVDQVSDVGTYMKIAALCNGVSILDNYWLRLHTGPQNWKDINIRHNSLNNTVAQIALHGYSISVEGSLTTPELTTDGVYPKAWRRVGRDLYLYKADRTICGKSLTEVMVSNILDKTNAQHCMYEAVTDEGKQMCRCKVLTDDKHSIVPAYDYLVYCKHNNVDFLKAIMDLDKESIHKMCIVDYLISNSDRHSRNWGFLYKPNTMELIGCHPLFDHNNAFDESFMKNRDSVYRFNKRSMRETAKAAMEEVDFHFISEIIRDDFLTDEQYDEFMWRANDIGVTVQCTYTDRILEAMREVGVNWHITEVKQYLPKEVMDYSAIKSTLEFMLSLD